MCIIELIRVKKVSWRWSISLNGFVCLTWIWDLGRLWTSDHAKFWLNCGRVKSGQNSPIIDLLFVLTDTGSYECIILYVWHVLLGYCLIFKRRWWPKKIQSKLEKKRNLEKKLTKKFVCQLDRLVGYTQRAVDRAYR